MKINATLQGNIRNLMRHCGYFLEKEDREEMAFCRILGASKSGYPRFHIYLKIDPVSRKTIINLHLDQKKPIYLGATAHSGEYDGKLVEQESKRIKQILGL